MRKRKKDQAAFALREKRDGQAVGLGVSLPSIPGVNSLSIAVRYLPGGKKKFLEFVKIAAQNGDKSALAWWTVYADLTKTQRDRCSYDDVCDAAGVRPGQLLAAMVGHGVEAQRDVGTLVMAAFHPEVVAAAGRSALRIDGEHAQIAADDRRSLLQAQGALPIPKGASIHVHANASANAQAAAAASTDPSVPKFADDIAALSRSRATVQKQMESGDPATAVIDAEPVSVDA